MEDAIKKASTPGSGADGHASKQQKKSTEAFVGYVDNAAADKAADPLKIKPATSAKALDRWFRERQQNKGHPICWKFPMKR